MVYRNLARSTGLTAYADGSAYLDIAQLVSFSSLNEAVLSIDSSGSVALHDNWHEPI